MIQCLAIVTIIAAIEPPLPRAEIRITKEKYVSGEPIPLEFIVENVSEETIPSAYPDDEIFGRAILQVEFRMNNPVVALWISSTSCGRAVGSPLSRIPGTDRWWEELAPSVSIKARFQVVPILKSGIMTTPADYRALPPGRYDIVGVIPWGDKNPPLKTSPVTIEIIGTSRADERQAAELVDATYISFFMDAMAGFEYLEPTESVAKILELYPETIHAVRIRNRLTLLRIRAIEFMGRTEIIEDARLLGYVRQIAADIKEGVAGKTNDILELDILSEAATKLFLKLEWVDELEMTSKILDERYPETEQAKTAREELAKLKARKGL